jgi:RND family efflux transporter MFP subunit
VSNDNEAGLKNEYVPYYRRKYVLLVSALIAVGILSVAIGSYLRSRKYLYTDDAIVDGQKISISSECPGRIKKLTESEGSTVKKDELLVELDDSEINAEKTKAESTLLSSEENEKLCASNLEKANITFGRTKALYKSGAIPLVQYEQSEKELNGIKTQKSLADLQVVSARAQLKVADTQRRFTKIYSPDDGVIAKKWMSEGDVVQPGQVLYTVYNLQTVSVLANVDEDDFKNVRIGQAAFVTIDAYPGHKCEGKVISIFPCTASQLNTAQPNNTTNATGDFTKLTQYVPIRILLDGISNNDLDHFPILPGMSVEVRVMVGK